MGSAVNPVIAPDPMAVAIEEGLSLDEVGARRALFGLNEVPEPRASFWREVALRFWGLSAWMLEAIIVLSAILHRWLDAGVALLLLMANAVMSLFERRRASVAVEALRRRLSLSARVLRGGRWSALPARELVPGDVVRLRAGDFVPADVKLARGGLRADQSALTGESAEITPGEGSVVYSGTVVHHGEATGVVVATGLRTFFGRTAHLVESARPKLHVEEITRRIVQWLFAIVATLVVLVLGLALVRGSSLLELLPLSLVLLMSAVPVALPVMFTVSMAVGSVQLSRRGVLITRLNAVEDAATMDVICVDKTGTMTRNLLEVVVTSPSPGFTGEDVVRFGAMASQEADQDPIDLAFLRGARAKAVAAGYRQLEFVPFSPETRRTESLVEWSGRSVRVAKGALDTIAALCQLPRAERAGLEEVAKADAARGLRTLAVARALPPGPFELVGVAGLQDPPRPDAAALVARLRAHGVAVKMLTGDALPVASEIGRELGLGRIVRMSQLRSEEERLGPGVEGIAEIYPEDKYEVVRRLQELGHVVGMTGDGVNDAPALKQAEVGVAVHGATDVARSAASAVLITEGLGGIIDLVVQGRATYQRVLTWVLNKISRTILKAGFVTLAYLATGRFVISASAMVLIVFISDFTKVALSTDHARGSQGPESWQLGRWMVVAVGLGVVLLAESLGALWAAWRAWGLGSDPGAMHTFSFQLLLFFGLFSILAIRERRWFWSSAPSWQLLSATTAGLIGGALVPELRLPGMVGLGLPRTAVVLAYCGLCGVIVNDLFKRLLMRIAGVPAPQAQAR